MKEEVNLELNDLRQFHVYSDPTRDFRHHSVEVTHTFDAKVIDFLEQFGRIGQLD